LPCPQGPFSKFNRGRIPKRKAHACRLAEHAEPSALYIHALLVKLRIAVSIRSVTTQEAMMDGEEGTAKYAKGAKKEARLRHNDESYRQSAILKQHANEVLPE